MEFVAGLDSLCMKLSEEQARELYHSLDKDNNGNISYTEFCNITEERRRGIDPFESKLGKDKKFRLPKNELSLGSGRARQDGARRRAESFAFNTIGAKQRKLSGGGATLSHFNPHGHWK